MVQQTYIIRLHEERLDLFKNDLTDLNQELEHVTRKIAELKYTEAATRVMQVSEAVLEQYMRSADKVLDFIHTARQSRMHLSLLTPKQLKPIYRDNCETVSMNLHLYHLPTRNTKIYQNIASVRQTYLFTKMRSPKRVRVYFC